MILLHFNLAYVVNNAKTTCVDNCGTDEIVYNYICTKCS